MLREILVQIIMISSFIQACTSSSKKEVSPVIVTKPTRLHLFTHTENQVEGHLLDIKRAEIHSVQKHPELSFSFDSRAELIEYEVFPMGSQTVEPVCLQTSPYCPPDESAVCENLRDLCDHSEDTFGPQKKRVYAAPLSMLSLPQGHYAIKLRACIPTSKSLSCGPYTEMEHTQEIHSKTLLWGYTYLQEQWFSKLDELAVDISKALYKYRQESKSDASCTRADDHGDLSYAVNVLDESLIQAAFHLTRIPKNLSAVPTKTDNASNDLTMAYPISPDKAPLPPQSVLLYRPTFSMDAPIHLNPKGLREFVNAYIIAKKTPSMLELEPSFIMQMIHKTLEVDPKQIQTSSACPARQDYDKTAQFLKKQLDAIEKQLKIVNERLQQEAGITGK